jgi:hypothetical protein
MQGAVLVDGFVRSMWRPKTDHGTTALLITPFVKPLPKSDQATVTEEARLLLDFLAPGVTHDVRFEPVKV